MENCKQKKQWKTQPEIQEMKSKQSFFIYKLIYERRRLQVFSPSPICPLQSLLLHDFKFLSEIKCETQAMPNQYNAIMQHWNEKPSVQINNKREKQVKRNRLIKFQGIFCIEAQGRACSLTSRNIELQWGEYFKCARVSFLKISMSFFFFQKSRTKNSSKFYYPCTIIIELQLKRVHHLFPIICEMKISISFFQQFLSTSNQNDRNEESRPWTNNQTELISLSFSSISCVSETTENEITLTKSRPELYKIL